MYQEDWCPGPNPVVGVVHLLVLSLGNEKNHWESHSRREDAGPDLPDHEGYAYWMSVRAELRVHPEGTVEKHVAADEAGPEDHSPSQQADGEEVTAADDHWALVA